MLHSFGANQGFVVSGDSRLAVDSGFPNRTALQILHRVRKLRPKRIVLVNTHYHSDHVLGNSVFAHKGTGVLSHEKCRRSLRRHSEHPLARHRARCPELVFWWNGWRFLTLPCHFGTGFSFFLKRHRIPKEPPRHRYKRSNSAVEI